MIESFEVYTIYSLSIKKNFTSKHFLPMVEGDENRVHEHDYRLEVMLWGEELDEDGFLVDIVELQSLIDSLVKKYEGRILNRMERFEGKNPTLENFCRIFWDDLKTRMTNKMDNDLGRITSLEIKLWETEEANASYHEEV